MGPPGRPVDRSLLPALLRERWVLGRMIVAELQRRFASSRGGLVWSLAVPAALLVVYLLVFSVVLGVRLPHHPTLFDYGVFLFCGMIPWTFLQDALSRAVTVYVDEASLVVNQPLPRALLPARTVVVSVLFELAAVAVLVLFLLVRRLMGWEIGSRPPGLGHLAILLTILVPVHFAFVLGLAELLALLQVYHRDTQYALGVAMTVGFFASPIVYDLELVPAVWRGIMKCNPLTPLLESWRALLLGSARLDPRDVLHYGLWALAAMLAAETAVRRTAAGIADRV